MISKIGKWIGVELDAVDWKEKLVSAAGGLISMLVLVAICRNALHLNGSAMLIASMGASAVLLFAVPHGQLSQPWPVIAGHVFSAAIGVGCARFIPDIPLAAGCAVGLAIGTMHVLKCIHPPGGATALTAVIGGANVKALGFSFVWSPVALNALTMVTVAVAFNYIFKWRRYPAYFNHPEKPPGGKPEISHETVVAALRSLDSFVDITEDDLLRLHDILSGSEKQAAATGRKKSLSETR
ncbi:MAG: HPP family protein [Verrucomicrobiota bacterium]